MHLARLRNVALGLGAILLLSFLFVNTQAIDFGEHDRYSSALRGLKELDATLNQDILRTRDELLTHYDPLVAELKALERLQNQLTFTPGFLSSQDRAELAARLTAHARVLAEKQALIERFKSANAILKNSLHYLPTAAAGFDRAAEHQARDRPLADEVSDLLQDVLVYNLRPNEELKPRIERRIERALGHRASASPELAGEPLENLVLHVRTILEHKPEVDGLTQEMIALPTAQRAEELSRT